MKRKILLTAIATVGLGMMASASMADTYLGQVVLVQSSVYSNNLGGEFNATLTYAPSVAQPVAAQPSSAGPYVGPSSVPANEAIFQTFCIQEGAHDVTFSPGAPYAAIINSTTFDKNDVSMSVNMITANLFSAFWNGGLAGYDYSLTDGLRATSAGELQAAIWVAQGDQSNDPAGWAAAASDAGISGSEITIAQNWYNTANPSIYTGPNNTAIEILAMYNNQSEAEAGTSNGINQSQLVEIDTNINFTNVSSSPLPSAAKEAMLLLGAMGVLRFARRGKNLA